MGHKTKHVEELLVISLEVQMPFHSCTWAKNLDGVNITYGTQHHWYHIWRYMHVAGATESICSSESILLYQIANCPYTNESDAVRSRPPPSIGNRSYCESGNPINGHRSYYIDVEGYLYHDDPLWNGQQYRSCCTGTNSPPWFSIQLPAQANNWNRSESWHYYQL